MSSTSLGLMIGKRRERGFIYRRGWGVLDGTAMVLDEVTVVDGGGLLMVAEIREGVGFAECTFVRASERFVG